MDIALTADKGGVGKTTLAYHIATRLRQLGQDVGLLDLDRRAASSKWVQAAEPPYLPAYRLTDLRAGLPEHDLRVWDTPAHPSAEMRRGLCGCDLVLVVAMSDLYSQEAAVELTRELLAAGGQAVIVINAVAPTGREGQEAVGALQAAGLPCCTTAVRRYSAYVHAQWDGRAVCDGAYGSADRAWSDISALTSELLAKEVCHVA